jgi:hypothetical protein
VTPNRVYVKPDQAGDWSGQSQFLFTRSTDSTEAGVTHAVGSQWADFAHVRTFLVL